MPEFQLTLEDVQQALKSYESQMALQQPGTPEHEMFRTLRLFLVLNGDLYQELLDSRYNRED